MVKEEKDGRRRNFMVKYYTVELFNGYIQEG